MSDDWRANLLESNAEINELLRGVKRVAVLGIKTENRASRPAFYVPEYLQGAGFQIIPVPVYYPEAQEILGEKVYRTVSSVPGPIDLVVVFRRSADLAPHLHDLLATRPAAVWLQTGIRDDDFARQLAEAGIRVVQDRCVMMEHRLLEFSS